MPDSIWTIRDVIEKLENQVHELEKQVDSLQNRMNYAIGGVAVIGVTAIINLVTNLLQTPGVMK